MNTVVNRKSLVNKRLVVKDGLKRLCVKVNFRVDDIAKLYTKAQTMLVKAEKDLKNEPTEENMTKYGECAIELFNVVFGKEQTQKLLKFFDGNRLEMLVCCFGFIADEIVPAFKENDVYTAMLNRK